MMFKTYHRRLSSGTIHYSLKIRVCGFEYGFVQSRTSTAPLASIVHQVTRLMLLECPVTYRRKMPAMKLAVLQILEYAALGLVHGKSQQCNLVYVDGPSNASFDGTNVVRNVSPRTDSYRRRGSRIQVVLKYHSKKYFSRRVDKA